MADEVDITNDRLDAEMRQFIASRLTKAEEEDSRYYCIDCEEDIPEARRLAVKGCKRCLACQSKLEQY